MKKDKDLLENYDEMPYKIRYLIQIKNNPAGKYWFPGRPEDVPLQRPQMSPKDPI